MTFWCGSGFGSAVLASDSCYFRSLTFNLILFLYFSAYYFLKVHLHHSSKMKSQKESQNSRNQGFSYHFWMMIEGSGSGSFPDPYLWLMDPDPGRPKICGSSGSGDPDPQHCLQLFLNVAKSPWTCFSTSILEILKIVHKLLNIPVKCHSF